MRLNVQIDNKKHNKKSGRSFTDCQKPFVLLTAAILPDVLPLSPAEGACPGGKVTTAYTLYSHVMV